MPTNIEAGIVENLVPSTARQREISPRLSAATSPITRVRPSAEKAKPAQAPVIGKLRMTRRCWRSQIWTTRASGAIAGLTVVPQLRGRPPKARRGSVGENTALQ